MAKAGWSEKLGCPKRLLLGGEWLAQSVKVGLSDRVHLI